MKRFSVQIPVWMQPLWPVVLIMLGAAILLTHQLAALAPRLSPTEHTTLASSKHLSEIFENPAPLPLRLLEWVTKHLSGDQLLWARLPSVLLALTALCLLAFILYRWYGRRSMVFGLLLIASSAWFLHVGRFAGPEIEYFLAILALIAVHLELHDNEESKLAWYAWLIINTLLLFIPGLLWFVLLSFIWQWRAIGRAVASQTIWQWCLSAVIPVVGLVWAGFVVIRSYHALWTLLGLPTKVPTLSNLLHQLQQTVLFFVYRGPNRPELWLGQLPILDLFVLAMCVSGVYFYGRHWRAERTQLLGGYLLLGIILVSLGVVGISVIVPILYLIAVAGIAYVLHFWLRRFPYNPLAHYFGVSIMGLLILLSCYYNVSQYFVAWPHNPGMVSVYRSSR